MLDFSWAVVVWLVQMAGTWALVAGSVCLLFLRLSFSMFAVARSVFTFAPVVALAYRYGFATDGVEGWLNTFVTKYVAMAAVAAVALVILCLVYVAVGPSGARKARCVRLFMGASSSATAPTAAGTPTPAKPSRAAPTGGPAPPPTPTRSPP
ncbi:hypothetical protein [Streptomyces regalis]|uniref:Uncharacterized protein n=1 Tax=Streptomyces regalis TaxID=68262 RepID=A0A117MLC5_9ACTN|nr:hypothetical protein [Streptomyces regalis]KUL23722.1 hypothetical protein ADL12_38775 [Streptomyces regalis]